MGSGTSAYVDGMGTDASISYANGIAVDVIGNVYLADGGNQRIRKITPNGTITTLAGSIYGYLDGIGTAAQFSYPIALVVDQTGTIFVSDFGNQRIRKITSSLADVNFQAKNQVLVYPNPASKLLNIELEDNSITKITLFDLNGRALQNINLSINKTTIDISNLDNGIYLMQIIMNKDIVLKKIFKN